MDEQCGKIQLQMVLNGKKNVSIFDEKFIKDYDEDLDEGYIIEVDAKYPKTIHAFYNDLPLFDQKE